jgi:hypothetical protein
LFIFVLDTGPFTAILNKMARRSEYMPVSLYKRKTLFFIIFFIALTAFSADILDLREELHILSCPYSSLDNNVTTGLISNFQFKLAPILTPCRVQRKVLVKISFLHLLPYSFRAPPSWS